jgi:hypothetical protein
MNAKLPPMTKIKKEPKDPKDPKEQKEPKEPKEPKKPKKCQLKGCKKKLPITAFDCRCKKRFCKLHFNAESHNCTFDYESFHKNNLSTYVVDKLERI